MSPVSYGNNVFKTFSRIEFYCRHRQHIPARTHALPAQIIVPLLNVQRLKCPRSPSALGKYQRLGSYVLDTDKDIKPDGGWAQFLNLYYNSLPLWNLTKRAERQKAQNSKCFEKARFHNRKSTTPAGVCGSKRQGYPAKLLAPDSQLPVNAETAQDGTARNFSRLAASQELGTWSIDRFRLADHSSVATVLLTLANFRNQ